MKKSLIALALATLASPLAQADVHCSVARESKEGQFDQMIESGRKVLDGKTSETFVLIDGKLEPLPENPDWAFWQRANKSVMIGFSRAYEETSLSVHLAEINLKRKGNLARNRASAIGKGHVILIDFASQLAVTCFEQ